MLRRALIVIVVLLMGACLLVVAARYMVEAQARSLISRQQGYLHSLSMAIEGYYADHGSYPTMAMRVGNGRIAVPTASGQAVIAGDTADFRTYSSPARPLVADAVIRGRTLRAWSHNGQATEQFAMLTTPVVYVYQYGLDIHTSHLLPPRYHATRDSYIVGSFGPDRDEKTGGDLPWTAPFAGFDNPNPPLGSMEHVFDTRVPQPSITILTGSSTGPRKGAFTYDITNGTLSEGDLWRVGGKAGAVDSP